MDYDPDERQLIADDWPAEVDDTDARLDWGWQPKYGLDEMTKDMLHCLGMKKEQ
jgi:nucleoside-diphosphate-sugar epimerase